MTKSDSTPARLSRHSPVALAASLWLAACAHAAPAAAPAPAPTTAPDTAPAAPNNTSAAEAHALAEGRRWSAAFFAGQTQAVWDQFDDEMQKALGSKAAFDSFHERVAQLGAETQIVKESVEPRGGLTLYLRDCVLAQGPTPVRLAIAFGAQGKIAGFVIKPTGAPVAAPTDKLDYQTKTALRLPFQGTWTVAWGGRTLEQNQHVVARDQRFAYDLLIVRGDSTHAGDGKKNSDYFCEGQAIFAPGAGKVADAGDGIAENIPGQLNAIEPMGNHVVIDHGNGELSFLAHFQTGSVLVKTGDFVSAGQPIGKCGNSGHSSEPHLHYHLQDTAKFGAGQGLPAQFIGYVANGKPVSRGEPVRGETIERGPAAN